MKKFKIKRKGTLNPPFLLFYFILQSKEVGKIEQATKVQRF